MGKKRDRVEIEAKILRVARRPSKKSHIVYKSNLNFKQMKRYLRDLIGNDLLSKRDERNFQTTRKGVEFIKAFDNLQRLRGVSGVDRTF